MSTQLNPILRHGASVTLVALIILCLAWELRLAPLRPGGSLLALKALPLLLPLRGVLKGSLYTLQWAAMLILLYFMEGVVRAWSDTSPVSVALALAETGLALVFYCCAIFYLKPAKRAAKLAAKNAEAMVAGGAAGIAARITPDGVPDEVPGQVHDAAGDAPRSAAPQS